MKIKLITWRTVTVNHVLKHCNKSTYRSLLSTLELQSKIPQQYKLKSFVVDTYNPTRLDISMKAHAEKFSSSGDGYQTLTSLRTDIILLDGERL